MHVQGQLFSIDLHVLPLCSEDLVLGVQRLKFLGLVLTDYNDLTMKFLHSSRVIELKGDTDLELHSITSLQLHRLVCKDGASGFFHIGIVSEELPLT